MEIFLSFTSATLAATFVFLLFVYSILKLTKKNNDKTAPEAAGAWPIIGHLRALGGSDQLLHKTLGSMADKYGPIFSLRIGVHQALVVSDSNIAKECFTSKDKFMPNRPKSMVIEIVGYNYATFGFGPYGPFWRKIRKIVMQELLSNSRLEFLGHIRVSEVKASINNIYVSWTKKESSSDTTMVEMKDWFSSLVLKMVLRMLFGEWYSTNEEEKHRAQEAMRKFLELSFVFVPSDAIPYLRFLDLGGYEKKMKKIAKEIDGILESWLDEHKRKRSSRQVIKEMDQDFMGMMLSIFDGAKAEEFGGYDADTVNKATCLSLLSAATDTTTITLIWALSLLINNPHALKKAQEELDTHVGTQRQVQDSDMHNLVYLQAIIKETLRMYPAVPITPHETLEECTVAGYKVAKGTRLMFNLWKIQHDPQVWPEPDVFQPERFVSSHKNIDDNWETHFDLIPFGGGRRICPGSNLSMQIMMLTLATLIQGFDLVAPLGKPIDMTESAGLTNMKASPLEVLLAPRLAPSLYTL